MKKILILFTALLLTSIGLYAQSAPEGMRYQAIARSLDGSLLKGQPLNVQVELFSAGTQEKIHYSEMHNVRSSDLGLLDFVIGEGSQPSGKFSDIPWVNDEMWVRISIKLESDDHYQIISSGQLFSVPYALYATTAGELKSNENENGGQRSMYSINWTLEGNHNIQEWNNGNPKLGTTDRRNLVFATNNIHRFVIDKDGMINFLFDVDINGDVNVDGPTTLNGTLTVTNMSSTSLTGTLTVNKATTLNDALTVTNMANTSLTGSLDVDQAMNVDGATTLNKPLTVTSNAATSLSHTLTVNGTTTLGDDLTVANEAPTSITGTLDVDKTLNVDGATTLQSTLNVGGNTDLNGSLTVDNTTTLNDDLTVENEAPTHFTGDLTVDGNVNAGSFTVDAELLVDGNTHLTGTLDVNQHANLDAGLQVNGNGTVGVEPTHLAYFNNTEGGSSDGIAIRIANNEMNKENNFMTFYRGGSVAGRIESYQIGDLDDIPAPTTDEIWSAVCIGIADYNPLSIMWTQMATAWNLLGDGWNALTIPSFDIPDVPAFTIPDVPALTIPDVPAFVIPDVPGFVTSDIPGFVIPDIPALVVGPYLCVDETICFCPCGIDITEWECCCEEVEVCLIPEFTLFPAIVLPDFPGIPIPDFPGIPIPDFPGINIPDFPGVAIPDFPGLEIPAVPELDFSALWGTAPVLPTLSDLLVQQGVCPDVDLFDLEDGYFRRLASWAFEHRLHNLVALDPIRLLGNALAWGLTSAVTHEGAVYGSKGADYAEYLPKMYPTEQFLKGEVVGVHNGKISKVTTDADQILAITSQPLVLGNMPESGGEEEMEKIAFLGQIPVFVMGPVKVGDYIIASGKNDGTAKAVSASDITVDMLSSVLGTAWSAYDGEGITMINTSIGLRPQEVTEVIMEQQKLEDQLHQQVQTQRSNSEIMTGDIERLKRAAGLSKEVYNP